MGKGKRKQKKENKKDKKGENKGTDKKEGAVGKKQCKEEIKTKRTKRKINQKELSRETIARNPKGRQEKAFNPYRIETEAKTAPHIKQCACQQSSTPSQVNIPEKTTIGKH